MISRVMVLVALIVAGGAACGRRGELLGTVAEGELAPPHFAPPQPVIALSDPDSIDEDPTFTGDALELYFMSNRNGTKDIWTSRRAVTTEPWPSPSLVTELSSSATDYSPGISLDGLNIWFATDRDMSRGRIWHAARASRADAWQTPTPVAELASGSIDFAPVVDSTGTTMAFTSNRPGGGGYDIYFATRSTSADVWGAVAAAPGAVNSASDEYDPFVSGDDRVLFFTSMRSGAGDIYWTARRSVDDPFQAPTLLTELDSADYDSDSTLSPDLTYMMFSSTRSGNAELYETTALAP
ncbi:MAG TPA: hypothetical protein VGP07_16010 [Polyangia bacterium]